MRVRGCGEATLRAPHARRQLNNRSPPPHRRALSPLPTTSLVTHTLTADPPPLPRARCTLCPGARRPRTARAARAPPWTDGSSLWRPPTRGGHPWLWGGMWCVVGLACRGCGGVGRFSRERVVRETRFRVFLFRFAAVREPLSQCLPSPPATRAWPTDARVPVPPARPRGRATGWTRRRKVGVCACVRGVCVVCWARPPTPHSHAWTSMRGRSAPP